MLPFRSGSLRVAHLEWEINHAALCDFSLISIHSPHEKYKTLLPFSKEYYKVKQHLRPWHLMPHSAPEFSNRQDFAFMKSRMVPSKNYSLNSFMAGIPNVGHGKQNRPQRSTRQKLVISAGNASQFNIQRFTEDIVCYAT